MPSSSNPVSLTIWEISASGVYDRPSKRLPTNPCCLVRNFTDDPTPIFRDSSMSLRICSGAATPTRTGRGTPGSRVVRGAPQQRAAATAAHPQAASSSPHRAQPADERAGVEAELADHVIGIGLFALQCVNEGIVCDVGVPLRVTAHADALQVVVEVLDRFQDVERLAVFADRVRAVATDHVEVVDTHRAQYPQEAL